MHRMVSGHPGWAYGSGHTGKYRIDRSMAFGIHLPAAPAETGHVTVDNHPTDTLSENQQEQDSAIPSEPFTIDIRPDEKKVYVTFHKAQTLPLCSDIVSALGDRGIRYWIDEATIEQELAGGVTGKPFVAAYATDASAAIRIEKGAMEAYLTLQPACGGRDLTVEGLLEKIESAGVTFGVSTGTVRSAVMEKTYELPILFASGKEPVHGTDAVIELGFPTEFKVEPKVLENDKVDYKELQMIVTVAKGDVLARKTPATSGESGCTVTGKVLAAKAGKDKQLLKGRNTTLSADGLTVSADIDGQPLLKGNAIFVEPVFIVEKDVNYSVGNINFKGSVKILGSVLAGFTVKATENIEIDGVVEDAVIEAGRDINIKGGVLGADRCAVRAGRDIALFFVENCSIEAGRNVTVGDVLNSEMSAGDSINAILGRGRILGGKLTAGNLITANVLGAGAVSKTQVMVGFEPKIVARVKELKSVLAKVEYTYEEIGKHIHTLEEMRSTNPLPPEKEILYKRLLATEVELKNNIEELTGEVTTLETAMTRSSEPLVKIRKACQPNVRVRIGRLYFDCQEEYNSAVFYEEENEIKVSVYTSFT